MQRVRHGGAAGFTLVELMVVVGVLGVLSTVAIVAYRKYAQRAKTTEAYSMLGLIRMRQESYRSEFSQYCDVSGSGTGTSGAVSRGYWPMTAPNGTTPVDWYSGLPAEWTQLGVRPTGLVYFRYDTIAGNPGVAPAAAGGGDLGYSAAPNQDAWWLAHAYGDLNSDGVLSTFESFSMKSTIWVSPNETE